MVERVAAPGLERRILQKLPGALLTGNVLPILAAAAMRWLPSPESGAAIAKRFQLIDALAAGLIVTCWFAALALAIGCLIVVVTKGPVRTADSYPLIDFDRPDGIYIDRSLMTPPIAGTGPAAHRALTDRSTLPSVNSTAATRRRARRRPRPHAPAA